MEILRQDLLGHLKYVFLSQDPGDKYYHKDAAAGFKDGRGLTRISPQLSTAALDPGMSSALRSVGLLDVLSSTPASPSGAAAPCFARLVSTPVCAASLRNLVRNAD